MLPQTPRLTLEHLTLVDAPFIRELFNDPIFLRHVGDRGIRTLADAEDYIRASGLESYGRHGYGMYRVTLTASGEAIGLCGLLKRHYLPEPDLGLAFLERFRSQGFATEAAVAVLAYARDDLELDTVLAIVAPGNVASRRILSKLGFEHESLVRIGDGEDELCLYATAQGGGGR